MSRRLTVGAVVLVAILSGCHGGKPESAPSPEPTPVEACVTDEEQRAGAVHLELGGDKALDGVVVGTGDVGIVFANQLPETLCGWREWAGPLESKYRMLLFDYSGGPADKDVVAAASELRKRGVHKVFLVGASLGGNAVLAAGPQVQPPVAGVVSLSAPADFNGVDALAAVRKLTAPVFLVAAKDDLPFGPDAQRLYDACPAADRKLDLEDGGLHGRSLLDDTMSTKVETFLTSH